MAGGGRPAREALQGRLLLLLDLVALAVAVSLAAQWQLDGAARHTAAEPGHSALEQLPGTVRLSCASGGGGQLDAVRTLEL